MGQEDLLEKEWQLGQYSCLENPMDRGVVRATVHVVARVGHNLVTNLTSIRLQRTHFPVICF